MSQSPKDEASPELDKQQDKALWKSWLPREPGAILFSLVMIVCLIIGIIHFARTSDISMMTLLLVYASAYAGLPEVRAGLTEVKSLLTSRQKKEENPPAQEG